MNTVSISYAIGGLRSAEEAKQFFASQTASVIQVIMEHELITREAPEGHRFWFLMRHIEVLDAADSYDPSDDFGERGLCIQDLRFQYKLIKKIIPKDPEQAINIIDQIPDPSLRLKLIFRCLRYDSEAVLRNLQEFSLTQEETALVALRASYLNPENADLLITDHSLFHLLSNPHEPLLSPAMTQFAFTHVACIDEWLQKVCPECLNYLDLFTRISENKPFEDIPGFAETREHHLTSMYDNLEPASQSSFAAVLFFLISIKRRQDVLAHPFIARAIKEVIQLKDPSLRFGFLLLLQDYINQTDRPLPPAGNTEYLPQIYAFLTLLYGDKGVTRWKDSSKAKHDIRLAIDLYFSSLSEDRKRTLFVETTDNDASKAIASCIATGYGRELDAETSGRVILLRHLQIELDLLAKECECSLTIDAGKLKHEMYIFEYIVSIHRLEQQAQIRVGRAFLEFLYHVSNGTFHKFRYHTRSFNYVEIDIQAWRSFQPMDINTLFFTSNHSITSASALDFRQLLLQSFEHDHLPQDAYLNLYNHLTNAHPIDPQDDVERICVELMACQDLNLALKLVKRAFRIFKDHQEMENDCRGWLKSISSRLKAIQSESNWKESTVLITDDPYDLFLSGSLEPTITCQRTSGDPSKNKCLMSTTNDGKTVLIEVRNKKGQRKARALLQLFLTDPDQALTDHPTKQAPVLVLNPIYPASPDYPQYKDAIVLAATKHAKSLNLPLIRRSTDSHPQGISFSPVVIPSSAPFEYLDLAENARNKVCMHHPENSSFRYAESIPGDFLEFIVTDEG